ncbi:hypothetical protein DMC47_09540 [Nostoc sp. 3335mG]|nr:hypothetical protein DMC47_09540 [Nostoc sp. 3335mG]
MVGGETRALQNGEDERDDRRRRQRRIPDTGRSPDERANHRGIAEYEVANAHRDHQRDDHRPDDLHGEQVEGEDLGPDQKLIRLVARGHGERMAEVLQDRGNLVPAQRAIERLLAILDPAGQHVAQLSDDIVRLARGQVATDGRQVTVDKIGH